MNKIFLFILHDYKLNYYNFEKLYKPEKTKIVAFLAKKVYDKIPESTRKWFDGFIFVNEYKYPGIETQLIFIDKTDLTNKLEQEIKDNLQCDLVLYCDDESTLDSVSLIVDKYKVKGLQSSTVNKFRDKIVMKSILGKNNIRVPKYLKLDTNLLFENSKKYYDEIIETVGLPFVIKPVNGGGSYSTDKINCRDKFNDFIQQIIPFIKMTGFEFEAEEFINGKMYSCDSVIRNSEIIFSGCTEYFSPYLDIIKNGGNAGHLILKPEQELSKRIVDFSRSVLKALNVPNCVTHMELFLSDENELVFIEVSARPAGVCIPKAYYYSSGINLFHEHFYSVSGINNDFILHDFRQVCGCSIYPKEDKIIKKINTPIVSNPYIIEKLCSLERKINKTKTIGDNVINFYIFNKEDKSFDDDLKIVKAFDFFEIV